MTHYHRSLRHAKNRVDAHDALKLRVYESLFDSRIVFGLLQ